MVFIVIMTVFAAIAIDAQGADDGAGTLGAASFIVNDLEYEVTGPETVAVVGYTKIGTGLVIPGHLVDPYDPHKIYKVEMIADGVFSGCAELTFVDARWIWYIGENAFAGCTGLKWVNICSAREIGAGAFSGCAGLGTATVTDAANIAEDSFDAGTVMIKLEYFTVHYYGTAYSYLNSTGNVEIRFLMPGYIVEDIFAYEPWSYYPIGYERTGLDTWAFDTDPGPIRVIMSAMTVGTVIEAEFLTEKHGNVEYWIDGYGWNSLTHDGILTVPHESVIGMRAVGTSEGYTAVFETGFRSFDEMTVNVAPFALHIYISFLPAEYEVTLPAYNEGTFTFSEAPLKIIGSKAWFVYGTDVTITAIPYSFSGYAFEWTSGGTVSGDGNEAITLTVTSDTVLDGRVVPNEYEIFVNIPSGVVAEYTVGGDTTVYEVPADGTICVPFGASLTISATDAEEGFAWNKGTGLSVVGNSVEFTVKGDRDIVGTYPPAAQADTPGTAIIVILVLMSAVVAALLMRSVRQ